MTHSKRLFLAAVLAASGSLALAQNPSQTATAQPAAGESVQRAERMDPARLQQRMAERHARRMADLKAQLRIEPQQEGAWSAYEAAMQPPAEPWRRRMNRDELAQLNTPQRIDRMQQLAAERQQRMQQRGEATKAFYAQLAPGQQQIFDQQAMRGGKRGHGMGPGWR